MMNNDFLYLSLDRDFNIIYTHPQLSEICPDLTRQDYVTSIMAGYHSKDLTVPTLVETSMLSTPDVRLVAVLQGDVINCYGVHTDDSYHKSRLNLVSYQMREPISSIFALLPIITDSLEKADTDKAAMYIESVYSKSYKMLRTVNNISTATKVLTGHNFRKEAVDLSQLIDSLTTSVQAIEKDVTINLETDKDIVINGNLNLLTVGLLNLIANSIGYKTDEPVQINIKLQSKGKTAAFTYSDNSKGIKDEFQTLVFNPYFSKDPYNDGEADPSLGLGLFIAKAGFNHAGAGLLLTSRFGEGVKYSASFPVYSGDSTVLKSNATDFLLNRYSDIFVQLCDSCKLPSLK